jgi:hypothetical protein
MEKIINKLINEFTKGVDTYTHNGSTWLIFTDKKEWVIELTNAKTLWYNYHFFKGMFSYASLDCVQNQHLITKWVEDNIINGVNHTGFPDWNRDKIAKYAIQNGIKKTEYHKGIRPSAVENSILNGVKETHFNPEENKSWVEGVIKNGVKRTQNNPFSMITNVENTIQNGVKETNPVDVMKFFDNKMEDTIQNGVKSSTPRQYVGEDIIDRIIDKGIIETHDDVYHHKGRIDGVIKNGVKEIKPLPAQTGNRDWSEYYHGREDRTKPFNDYLNDTLEMGVKIK